jgi:hypothetical protein
MNSIDKCLDRLLRAAAAAPQDQPGELPFTIEARVLGRWRSSRAQGQSPWLLPWLRIGLACACLVMLAAFVLSLQHLNRSSEEEWTMPSAVVNLALTR